MTNPHRDDLEQMLRKIEEKEGPITFEAEVGALANGYYPDRQSYLNNHCHTCGNDMPRGDIVRANGTRTTYTLFHMQLMHANKQDQGDTLPQANVQAPYESATF